ncbi:uncharacterized protein SCHCODRAFT_02515409 [Schizophyllum commune H4-8]|nr:uncharacterized protein SCHCODRAFT_02515409 [Schizophyllum commune H4-8]KAI5887855.1 hypothetical protein SCHCODRAFT_02515409 [Schizophyllum commune H4-8]
MTSSVSRSTARSSAVSVDFGSAQQMRVLCDKLQKQTTFLSAAALLATWARLDDFEVGRCGRKILICYSMAHRYLRGEDIDLSPFVGCLPCVYSHKRVYFDLLWPLYQRRHVFDADQRERLSLLLTPFAITGPVGLPCRQPPQGSGFWDIDACAIPTGPCKASYRLISRPKQSLEQAPTTASSQPSQDARPRSYSSSACPPGSPDPLAIAKSLLAAPKPTSSSPSTTSTASAPSTPSVMQRLVKLIAPKPDEKRRRSKHKRSGAVSISSEDKSPTSARYNPLSMAGRRNALFDFADKDQSDGEDGSGKRSCSGDGNGAGGSRGTGGKECESKDEHEPIWRPRPQRFGIFCTGKGGQKAPRSLHLVGQ